MMQARRQKLLLGVSFGQNVDPFGKIVDLFSQKCGPFKQNRRYFSKIMLFKQNSGFLALKLEVLNKILKQNSEPFNGPFI